MRSHLNHLPRVGIPLIVTLILLLSLNTKAAAVQWQRCDSDTSTNFLCSTVHVPLTYNKAPSSSLPLHLIKHSPVNQQKTLKGDIIVSFGGPWAEDIQVLREYLEDLPKSIVSNYTIYAINLRGVDNTAFDCRSPLNHTIAQLDLTQWKNWLELFQLQKQKLRTCRKQFTPVAQHAGLSTNVNDIETIRQALDLNQFTFITYSYSARLAAYYAAQYPNHVKQIIFDSPMTLKPDFLHFVKGQAYSYERTLRRFFELCQASRHCPLQKTPRKALQATFDTLRDKKHIPAQHIEGQPSFTSAMLEHIVLDVLPNVGYSEDTDEPTDWQILAEALNAFLTTGDPSSLMRIYINLTDYNPEAQQHDYNNNEVNSVALCSSYMFRPDKTTLLRFFNNNSQQIPMIGTASAGELLMLCAGWPSNQNAIAPLKQMANKVPTLIISNETDPQTPRQWANEIHHMFGNTTMLTFNGVGHGVFAINAYLSDCINKHVMLFLEQSTLNQDTVHCKDAENPFK